MRTNSVDDKIDQLGETLLRLSDDIGKMADRIGDMAARIGMMSDRMLETQRIQSENLQKTQEAQLELLRVMGQTLSDNNRLIAELARGAKGSG